MRFTSPSASGRRNSTRISRASGGFSPARPGNIISAPCKPVVYPARLAPHIPFQNQNQGSEPWTTQIFIKGFPGNERDGVYADSARQGRRNPVTVEFAPVKESRIGDLAAKFDIIPGATPPDEGPH